MRNSNPMELSSFDFREYFYWGRERGKNVINSGLFYVSKIPQNLFFVIHF
jgi:hypothetical protein